MTRISQFTADMEQVLRDEKMVEIKLFYDENATGIHPWAEDLFSSDWFYEKAWGNKTTKDWKWKRELLAKIAVAKMSITEIESFAGINANAVIAKYIETGSLGAARSFYSSIITKANPFTKGSETSEPPFSHCGLPTPRESQDGSVQLEELLLTVYVSQEQRQFLLEYLTQSGIKFKLWNGLNP